MPITYVDIEIALRGIQKSLIAAAIGSCTCLTKSPVLGHHDADCRYLKISNALEAIESLQARERTAGAGCGRSVIEPWRGG